MYWGPELLMAVVFLVAVRWIVSRYKKIFAAQAENTKAQTAATLQLAHAMERIAAALEKMDGASR
jgi:hypothetical protein